MKQRYEISRLLIAAFIAITFCSLSPLTCDAAVRAQLDRQTISIDETVNLIVEADGALNSIASLDTSGLEKDFSILNNSSSSNFQIINGSSKATKTWTLELEPKRTGTFTIPPFSIGGEKTSALTLTVTTPTPLTPGVSGTNLPDVFIEVTPEMETPAYIQAQITISVKLFIKSQLRLSEASLEEPSLGHATIIKLGDDRRYQSHKNNATYQVIERKYAIIAEEGHEVTIPPLLFQAISTSGGSRHLLADPFFDRFSGRGQRLRIRSQELKIALTQIPDDFKGKVWLPARQVSIMENLDGKKELKVGEPLTRTIQIEALGLTAEQLPSINPKTPDGAKIYLDQAEHKTKIDGDLLHAVKRQAMAFIPSREGLFTLPEITIDWWDVVNNIQQRAVLPAREIKVVKAAGQVSKAPPQNSEPTPSTSHPETEPENAKSPDSTAVNLTPTNSTHLWQGISAILLLVWIVTLMLWIKARRRPGKPRKKETKPEKKQSESRDPIKKACLANNPLAAHQAILDWAAASWPQTPPTNLKAVAATLKNPELNKAFANLEETLYSPTAQTWDGSHFWQTVANNLQKKTPTNSSRKQKKGLPPLYPHKD